MELKGKRNVETDHVTLWNMLMDIEILPKIVPGISKLEKNRRKYLQIYPGNKIWTR
jgi:carbon monoxide dehydrogenase subunit G